MTSRGVLTTLSNNSAGKKKREKKGTGLEERKGERVVVVVVTARGSCDPLTLPFLSPPQRVYTNPFSRVLF